MSNNSDDPILNKDSIHVVFGATGAYGYSVTKKLIQRGLNVLAVSRNTEKAKFMFPGVTRLESTDVFDKQRVREICKDASVIYFGINFPYREWKIKFREALENILHASWDSRPTFVFPGNVYGYGQFEYTPVNEEHPLNASTVKGMLRNRIEMELLKLHSDGKINLVLPRFADFYGPNVTNDLYGALFSNAIKGKSVLWPINADTPHCFTFIEDAAEATLFLLQDRTSYGNVFHISGHVTTAKKFIETIFSSLNARPKIRIASKRFLSILGIFNPDAKELLELLYEYERPYIIDDTKFLKRFPSFKHTSYDEGIKITLDWFRKHTV